MVTGNAHKIIRNAQGDNIYTAVTVAEKCGMISANSPMYICDMKKGKYSYDVLQFFALDAIQDSEVQLRTISVISVAT
jgi:magnesium-transporting ATPase (P-type)